MIGLPLIIQEIILQFKNTSCSNRKLLKSILDTVYKQTVKYQKIVKYFVKFYSSNNNIDSLKIAITKLTNGLATVVKFKKVHDQFETKCNCATIKKVTSDWLFALISIIDNFCTEFEQKLNYFSHIFTETLEPRLHIVCKEIAVILFRIRKNITCNFTINYNKLIFEFQKESPGF